MKTYSKQERIDMLLVIGECQENCFLASRVYAQKYSNRQHPNRNVFKRLSLTFRNTGSVEYKKQNRQRHVINEDTEFQVIASLIENHHTSQKRISEEIGLSRRSVSRIIKKYKFHPYRIQMHQELYASDFDRQIEFCLWVLDKAGGDDQFFNFVLFTDEATFHNNGLVNQHNFHYYSDENPHYFQTIDHQHRWSLNVWGGIVGSHVIGPHFFNGWLNARKFRRFLRSKLPALLDDVPLLTRRKMWLQLDGASVHYSIIVRRCINALFPEKWIGRGGPYDWPPRSPCLTPLDFFLWGYIKSIVYNTKPTTPEDMKERIRVAFGTITPQILQEVKKHFLERVQACIEQDGRHFEHIL